MFLLRAFGSVNLLDCDVPPNSQRYCQRNRYRVKDLREIAVKQQISCPAVAEIWFAWKLNKNTIKCCDNAIAGAV